jgi:3-phenylpropionate/trans-cinnamate dioxygenase ferredoxin reductase subunit
VAFWLDAGHIVGAMLGNEPGARKPLEALVRAGGPLDAARAADPSVPLSELA